jgi:hypothetical protein
MAILLGTSERFLLRLEKQAEAVIDPNPKGTSDQYAPANTPAAVQRVGLLRPRSEATTAATENGDPRPRPTAPAPAPSAPSEA